MKLKPSGVSRTCRNSNKIIYGMKFPFKSGHAKLDSQMESKLGTEVHWKVFSDL